MNHGDFQAQGGDPDVCSTRIGRLTGQVICTRCAPDCEHYLCTCEDDINHDTLREQTGTDA